MLVNIHGACMDTNEALLKAILATVARTTFPPEVLYKIVAPTTGSNKQLIAYNLCDGETPQAEIGKKAKLDPGNLSRLITKWIEAGIVVRVGAERLPLHIYPLMKLNKAASSDE
jgi:DNA-binding MarR family transcriptional regulator